MARATKGLYKRGSVWWMTYRDVAGKQRFESCKTRDKTEAEYKLICARKKIHEGEDPPAKLDPVPLADLETRYLAFVGHQRGVVTKRYHFAHYKRLWGNPPIHTLTVEVVDRYRETRRGEGVAPATINKEMATLKHALTQAVRWNLVRESVRKALTGVEKLREPSGRTRYLERDEATRLIEHCRGTLRPLVTVALHTGMRKSELLGLTWDAVNLKRNRISLRQTKNGEGRHIPINATVRRALTGLRTRLDVPLVFHGPDGRCLSDFRRAFEAACGKAGITDLHFHDLRHTFASWLTMDGVPLKTVADLLGHKSLTMTMRYAHLGAQHLDDAVRTLDGPAGTPLDSYLTVRGTTTTPEGGPSEGVRCA